MKSLIIFKPKLEKIKQIDLEKILIFQEIELSSSKIKKYPIFPEIELSNLIFFLYFRKELSELEKKTYSENFFLYLGKWNFLAPSIKLL